MKIALYMEDGLAQIVLTPENKQERAIAELLGAGNQSFAVKRGQFYENAYGYVREGANEMSIVLVLRATLKTTGQGM